MNAETKKQLQEKVNDLIDTLQRVQADFENYRKRTEKERCEFAQAACKDIVIELLPVVDNFELALKHTSNPEDFIKGIELVYVQMQDILRKSGLEPIKSLGEKFNPGFHEALMQEESEKEKGTIIEEFQKGYILGGKVIRHTKVKVAK